MLSSALQEGVRVSQNPAAASASSGHRIHGVGGALCRHHAECRRPVIRRSERRRRPRANDGRRRRRAVPHPSAAREPRHLRRSRSATVHADAGGRYAAERRARIAARHGALSAGSVPLPRVRRPHALGDDGQARGGQDARHAGLRVPREEPRILGGVQRRHDGAQRAGRGRGDRSLRLQHDRHARRRRRRPRRSADVDPESVSRASAGSSPMSAT